MSYSRVNVYKDRKGKWRWKLLAPNGRKIGASSESFEKRKWSISNLALVTGIQIERAPHNGGFWRKVNYLEVLIRAHIA